MAKRGGRSGRKYVRDNRGRFATTGATARGGRLKTAGGKKRATQTVKAKTNGKPGGTLKAKPRSEGQKYAKRVQAGKDLKRSQSTAREKKFFAETQKRLDAAPLAQSRAAAKKSVTANSARATGKLARPVAKGNIRRTGGRLGPKNTIKPGPKSPRTKMNRAIDNVIKKGKALKGSADKLRGVKKQADALRGRMLKEDKGRLSRALSKPSVTDKRSRDYGGRLTKGARGQDPATGGKKSRAKAAAAKPTAAATARKARIDGDAFAARAKKARGTELRRYINEGSRRDSLSSAQRVKTPLEVRQAASQKREAKSRSTASRAKAFYQNFGSPSTFSRRDRKSTRDSDRFGSKQRGAKKKSVTANSARAAAKRRGAVGKISEAKAGRIVARMDAQRGRKALPGRRNANFARTAERRSQFILKPAATARKKGKPISVNESVQKAVANAAKRRKPKPAAAQTKLKRSEQMSQKEKWAARAEKRRTQATKAEANAKRLRDANRKVGDNAFWTQPGLGKQRDKARAGLDKSFKELERAKKLRSRADSLERMSKRNKGDAASRQQLRRDKFDSRKISKGQTVNSTLYGPVKVLRVNKKTVTISLNGGKPFTEDKSRFREAL